MRITCVVFMVLVSSRGFAQHTLDFDTYNTYAGVLEVFDSTRLDSGQSYCLKVVGTYSIWPPNFWTNPCGFITKAPIYPSPAGGKTGLVAMDFEYAFSFPNSSYCTGKKFPHKALPSPRLEISLDSGKTWFHPSTNVKYNFKHIYHYSIVGQGYPIGVRHNSAANKDDYGILKFNLTKDPNLDLGNDTIFCGKDSVELITKVPQSTNYEWNNGAKDSSIWVSQGGSYSVTTTSSCRVQSDTIEVNFKPNPTVKLGKDTSLCDGDTLELDAYNLNATYEWHNGSTAPSLSTTKSGTFWVQTTLGDCALTDSIVVNFSSYPILNLGSDTSLCDGDTLKLDAYNANAVYKWQNGSVASTLLVATSGTYWVEATLANCPKSDSITIDFDPTPTVDLGRDTALCDGDTLELNAYNQNATYTWHDGTSNERLKASKSGTYRVNVQLNKCETTDSIAVNFNIIPEANLGVDTVGCKGTPLILDANLKNAKYLWQNGSDSSIFTATKSGVFWVQVTLENCSNSDTITATLNPNPVIDLGKDTSLCDGDTLKLDAYNPDAAYEWQNGALSKEFQVSEKGHYWVTVKLKNCQSSDSIKIDYTPNPMVNLGDSITACEGDTIVLQTLHPDAKNLWQDGSRNSTFVTTAPGTFSVAVTKGNCTSRDSVTVNYQLKHLVDIGNDTSLCEGDTLLLNTNIPDAQHIWQDGSQKQTLLVEHGGLYTVNVTVEACTASDGIYAQFKTTPDLNLGSDTSFCEGDSLKLEPDTTYISYLWQNISTENPKWVAEDGLYHLRVENECGFGYDTLRVVAEKCYCFMYVPNSFTPNGDGLNEEFKPSLFCDFSGYSLLIFNRWGERIFSNEDPEHGWLGDFKGKSVPIGAYLYIISYTDHMGQPQQQHGSVIVTK